MTGVQGTAKHWSKSPVPKQTEYWTQTRITILGKNLVPNLGQNLMLNLNQALHRGLSPIALPSQCTTPSQGNPGDSDPPS